MSLHENINAIIKKRGMNRKEFAIKLMDLKPTLNRIGEVPSLTAIYTYLNGSTSIKAELIPYIAEVLDVTEQELFDTSAKTRKRCFKYFVENAQQNELEYFNSFINSQITHNVNINYGNIIMNTKTKNDKLDEFVTLLEFAPTNFLDRAIVRLREYKNLSSEF
jgi:transcriptional regulator with XRE-family HTH domain